MVLRGLKTMNATGLLFSCCWNAKSTDVTTGATKYEDKSLYFIFKFTLLNIFYSLSFYHWMRAIFNIISLFNEHDLTNTSLMNIHINKSIYHHCIHIIWTWTTIEHIIWTWTIAKHTLSCWIWTIPLLDIGHLIKHFLILDIT